MFLFLKQSIGTNSAHIRVAFPEIRALLLIVAKTGEAMARRMTFSSPQSSSEKNGNNVSIAILSIISALAVSALLVALFYYLYMRQKVKKKSHGQGFKSESAGNSASKSAKYAAGKYSAALVFTYKQLQVATHNFHDANMVGRGGFGTVYKGVLPDGRTAAIKKLDQSSKQGDLEFRVKNPGL